ncbi:MAG: flagellar basal-body rod protein FlgF [Alphaproteobacteria bacterium CG_4_10_14_0_8_um_filter_53_9]|nr:MAG: flagellar basal-body rod protein FlgF [Alphaproteobacteria bacterium CG_4_10_14_0_8_um_filter_53_9]
MQELAVLAASAMATQRRFTAVADNIANANTDGYRKIDVQFKEIISRPNGHSTASYVEDRGLVVDFSGGSLRRTGNPMDVALGSEGFFAVQTEGGDIRYTRRGAFVVNSEGELTTPQGLPVLDNANAPIQIPQNSGVLAIARDGTISTREGQIAQIGVFTFSKEDQNQLLREGDGTFTATQGGANVAESPMIMQGFVESSNVNAVKEMTDMQMVSKAYQRSLTLMRGIEQIEQRAIRTLGETQ